MDVMMPVMNGYEATKAIRESNHPEAKTIPIIAMTANAYKEDVDKALDAGMNAHVPKPIDIQMLMSVLDNYRRKGDT
jgi:CheY-like chemotaxis protein